jgi:hypothetical protein
LATLAQIQTAAVREFAASSAEPLLRGLHPLADLLLATKTQHDFLCVCAAMLTTLLAAADATGLEHLDTRSLAGCRGTLDAVSSLRYYAQGMADANAVASCIAAFRALLWVNKIWIGQVKAIAWRRLQLQVVQ